MDDNFPDDYPPEDEEYDDYPSDDADYGSPDDAFIDGEDMPLF